MSKINVYCDESNHLENGGSNIMVLGAVYCPDSKKKEISSRVKELKVRHGLKSDFEIKWTKVSEAKETFYTDIVDYFYDDDDLHFRAVVIDKSTLNHERHQQDHNDWYYKMYYQLLTVMFNPNDEFYIYLDIKDTRGAQKVENLRDVLRSKHLDFDQKIIKRVQQIRSHESELMQVTDLLIGAIQAVNRDDIESAAKLRLIERIKERSKYSLVKTTLQQEKKTNLFYWQGTS